MRRHGDSASRPRCLHGLLPARCRRSLRTLHTWWAASSRMLHRALRLRTGTPPLSRLPRAYPRGAASLPSLALSRDPPDGRAPRPCAVGGRPGLAQRSRGAALCQSGPSHLWAQERRALAAQWLEEHRGAENRYYCAWRVGALDDWRGVHASVGGCCYDFLVREASPSGYPGTGALRWRRCDSLAAAAVALYAREQDRHRAPDRADFYAWPPWEPLSRARRAWERAEQ